eukprot:gene30506-37735_t
MIDGRVLSDTARKFISISTRELDLIFDSSRPVNLDEFLGQLTRGMSLDRKQLVSSVFRRLDVEGKGYVTIPAIQAHYRASTGHPTTVSGRIASGESLHHLVQNFSEETSTGFDTSASYGAKSPAGSPAKLSLNDKTEIEWKAFLDYYRCISMAFPSDADFELLVRNSWYFDCVDDDQNDCRCAKILGRGGSPVSSPKSRDGERPESRGSPELRNGNRGYLSATDRPQSSPDSSLRNGNRGFLSAGRSERGKSPFNMTNTDNGRSPGNTAYGQSMSRPATGSINDRLSTTQVDFTYKVPEDSPPSRNATTGRMLMDINYTHTRPKAEYVDGRNGYFRDSRLYGLEPTEYVTPKLVRPETSKDDFGRTITSTDYVNKEPLQIHYVITGGIGKNKGDNDLEFYNNGVNVGNSPVLKFVANKTGAKSPFLGPNSHHLRDMRTTTAQEFPLHRERQQANDKSLYARDVSGVRGTRSPARLYSGPQDSDTYEYGADRLTRTGTMRDGAASSQYGYAVTDEPTIRRVLVTHTNGTEEVVEIRDELGGMRYDSKYLMDRLTEQGVHNISDIRL